MEEISTFTINPYYIIVLAIAVGTVGIIALLTLTMSYTPYIVGFFMLIAFGNKLPRITSNSNVNYVIYGIVLFLLIYAAHLTYRTRIAINALADIGISIVVWFVAVLNSTIDPSDFMYFVIIIAGSYSAFTLISARNQKYFIIYKESDKTILISRICASLIYGLSALLYVNAYTLILLNRYYMGFLPISILIAFVAFGLDITKTRVQKKENNNKYNFDYEKEAKKRNITVIERKEE